MHGRPVLKIVIAYEDYPAGLRAFATAARVASQSASYFQVDDNLWNFKSLSDPVLRERATMAAARADMLVVSGHEVPLAVRTWIESWAESKTNVAAALVLLPTSNNPAEQLGMISDLREVTRARGIDFFCQAPSPDNLPQETVCPPWGFEPERPSDGSWERKNSSACGIQE